MSERVLRDEGREPVEREEVPHRRKRGRKPWAIEVRFSMLGWLGKDWLRYQRYETRERAEQALAVNVRKADRRQYRLIGPDGEIVLPPHLNTSFPRRRDDAWQTDDS